MQTAQTTRKKKESFVVFEDWMKYARCLNDAEFRQLFINVLNHYKGIAPTLNSTLLNEVWNDIIDDLNVNVAKKQAKRETMLANSKSNTKINPVSDTIPDIGSNIGSDTIPNTSGMVDGRCDMEDEMMEDIEWEMGNRKWEWEDKDLMDNVDLAFAEFKSFIK